MMGVWVYLKLNWNDSIQYKMDSGSVSHKLVLYHVSPDGTSLVLGKVTLTDVTNYYCALVMKFVPAKVDIDTSITKILSEIHIIKVHPTVFSYDQYISNISGRKLDKYLPKMALLTPPFRC